MDDKTWSDLEFPRFFTALDTTITPIGRQYLFAQLRTYEYDQDVLHRRYREYEILEADRELRERIQLALKPLEIDSAANIADLLLNPQLEGVPHSGLCAPLIVLALGAFICAVIHVLPLWLCAIPFVINMSIAWRADATLGRNADALLDCGRMLGVANRIAALRADDSLSCLSQLAAQTALRRELRAQIWWLWAVDSLRAVTAVFNYLFLLKLTIYAHSIDRFEKHRTRWLSTFQLLGARRRRHRRSRLPVEISGALSSEHRE